MIGLLKSLCRKVLGICPVCGKPRVEAVIKEFVVHNQMLGRHDLGIPSGECDVTIPNIPAMWCGTEGCEPVPTAYGEGMISRAARRAAYEFYNPQEAH